MSENFDSTLELCLTQIAAGKATVGNCLERYPHLADELEPMLLAADEMWAVPRPVLLPDAKARIEAQLLDAVRAQPAPRTAVRQRPRLRWGWATAGFGAVFALLLTLAVLVGMVGNTLPGSPLHTVKLAAESTWLWLAPADEEPKLRLYFARRRLDEVATLTAQGSIDPSIVDAMTEETEAALAVVEDLPPSEAVPLMDDLVELISDQQETLTDLLDKGATASQEEVAAALETNTDHKGRTRELISALPMPPAIAVSEVASLSRVSEPGGMVMFTIRVTNDGVEDVTLMSLVDDIHGDLNGQGTCAVPEQGIRLGPGESYECTFGAEVVGNAGDSDQGMVTAVAADDEGYAARVANGATVGITDVLPTLAVNKMASVTSLPEPGNIVQFTVRVTNNSVEALTLSSLVDDIHGNLDGRGTCSVPPAGIRLEADRWYECSFGADVFGNAGDLETDTITAVAEDDEGNEVKAGASATVVLSDVLPEIEVGKVATRRSVPEPGDEVQFSVRVTNRSVEGVTLTSLVDDVYGDLDGQGTCSVPEAGFALSVDGQYECTFSGPVSGNAGDVEVDTVTAHVSDDEGNRVQASASASVSIADVLPTISLTKEASPSSIREPGGSVRFTVRVTNPGVENVFLTSLVDDVHGDLTSKGSCLVPQEGIPLSPGGSYSCTYSSEVSGNAGYKEIGVVTARASDDEGNRVEASASSAVTITDALPAIEVSKTAMSSSVREPGRSVEFTVRVINRSVEDVAVISMVDDIHGNLSARGSCLVPQTGIRLSPGSSYRCAFSAEVSGNAGDTETDTVTALAVDDEENRVKAADDATIRITDVRPAIAVSAVASPSRVPEPGGDSQFTVHVTNNSVEEVMVTSLVDDVYGNLDGKGTCLVPQAGIALAPGALYRCTYDGEVAGNAGHVAINTVTAQASDDEGNRVKASGSARVTVTDVLPVITVIKTAGRQSVPEPGGAVEFGVLVRNDSVEDVTVRSVVDVLDGDLNGQGTCTVPEVGRTLEPGTSYRCKYTGNVVGNAADTVIGRVTAQASDDEGNNVEASGRSTVSITDVLPAITASMTADRSSVPEPAGMVRFTVRIVNHGVEAVTLTSLRDDVHGDLIGQGACSGALVGNMIGPGTSYECVFNAEVAGNAGDTETNTVTAQVSDDEGNQAEASASAVVGITDVLPAIVVSEVASPSSVPEPGGSVQFTVRVTNSGAEEITLRSLVDDVYGDLNDRGTCSLAGVSVAGGASYVCAFVADVMGNARYRETHTVRAVAADDEGNEVEASGNATVTITDLLPSLTVTVTANPSSVPEPGGTVQYTVFVTNRGVEAVTLTSLADHVYGNLDGWGTCSVPSAGISLAPGGLYGCAFSATVTGNAGEVKTDTVTAQASDDEGNRAEASDSAVVDITDVAPAISVDKTADVTSLPAPGGTVVFTVRVTNNSVEDVMLTVLMDDLYGDLDGRGTCSLPPQGQRLARGASYECAFGVDILGSTGESQADTVRAVAVDDEGNEVQATDSVTVTIAAVPQAVAAGATSSTCRAWTPICAAAGLERSEMLRVAEGLAASASHTS